MRVTTTSSGKYALFSAFVLLVLLVPPLHAAATCITFYPAGIGRVGMYNNCEVCMTAVTAWCDGSIREFNVPARSNLVVNTCIGTVTLVADHPCASPNAVANKEGAQALPQITESDRKTLLTITSATRVFSESTARTLENDRTRQSGSSCSASNDVGATCSITCPVGQAAECRPGTGASAPTCECR